MHHHNLPAASSGVENHLIHDATCSCQLSHVDLELDVVLAVVSHELELDLEVLRALLRKGGLVGLSSLLGRRPGLLGCDASDFDLLEKGEGLASVVNTTELNLGSILDKAHLKALLHLPDRDLIGELLHEALHDVVALCMDDQSGKVVERCLLQVANNETTSVLSTSSRHAVGRRYTKAGAHGKAEVCVSAVLLTKLKDSRVEVLAEVDDRVLEVTIAAWSLALASSSVLLGLLGVAHTVVAHELATTILAHLEVCVAMKLSNAGCRDAALAMETIDILADDVLEVLLLHELNERHVGQGWVGLLDGSAKGGSVCWLTSTSCTSALLLFSVLLLVGRGLPASRASAKNGVVARSVVGNSTGGRDTSTSESYKVARGDDHLGEKVELLIQHLRAVEVLLLLFFSLESSVCHFVVLVGLEVCFCFD